MKQALRDSLKSFIQQVQFEARDEWFDSRYVYQSPYVRAHSLAIADAKRSMVVRLRRLLKESGRG